MQFPSDNVRDIGRMTGGMYFGIQLEDVFKVELGKGNILELEIHQTLDVATHKFHGIACVYGVVSSARKFAVQFDLTQLKVSHDADALSPSKPFRRTAPNAILDPDDVSSRIKVAIDEFGSPVKIQVTRYLKMQNDGKFGGHLEIMGTPFEAVMDITHWTFHPYNAYGMLPPARPMGQARSRSRR